MVERERITHRGYTGEVFFGYAWPREDRPTWSLIVPEGGQVGVDGCVQYGNSHAGEYKHLGWAKIDFRKTVDRLIAAGGLPDREVQ